MTDDGGDGWSTSTRVGTVQRERRSDVDLARRAVASFGGGGPRWGESTRTFVRRYGWRAYALPVLVMLSVVALLTARNAGAPRKPAPVAQGGGTTRGAQRGQPVAARASAGAVRESGPVSSALVSSPPVSSPAGVPNTAYRQAGLAAGALPAGSSYTKFGNGTYRVLHGTSRAVGAGVLLRYDIEVENPITGVDLARFGALVQSTLADPRSWSGHGVRLERVDSGPVDFHVSLTSSMTVRKYCGFEIPIETSCYAGAGTAGLTVNRVVLNVARWVRGAASYPGDLNAYRIYMINHEDGHALGHQHAHQCLPGGLAPVMMQQTFGLKSAATGSECRANAWPYPPGVSGAPGAEQPDTP